MLDLHAEYREIKRMTDNEKKERTIQQRMAEEELIKERVDEHGVKWRKVYFGGGAHFQNWLAQCREIGEVAVEEVDSRGYKCFEEGGEKLYRIWMRIADKDQNDLFPVKSTIIC